MSKSKQEAAPEIVEQTLVDEAVDTVNSEEQSLADQVEQLQQQVADQEDQFLRAKAEMENIRRRSDKQVADSRKYAVESFAKELLSVKDSLQLAADAEVEQDDSDAVKSMREGLNLTLKQLDGVFEKFMIKEIAPEAGAKLDPNLHQAMTMVPAEDVEPGSIVSTLQKGYQLHDRLLRPAMVIVAQK
ncbi:MAG: nucleotide exchange factor GrpE [Arenicella sp.]